MKLYVRVEKDTYEENYGDSEYSRVSYEWEFDGGYVAETPEKYTDALLS